MIDFGIVDSAYAEALACDSCEGSQHWYVRKHRWIRRRAERHGVDIDLACAAYALMSWNNSVANNDRVFEGYLRTGEVWMMRSVEDRVRLCEQGRYVEAFTFENAAKIATFRDNLRFPWRFGGATIDRHAGDVVTGDRAVTKSLLARVRLSGYRYIESLYVAVAVKHGTLPSMVQARTWCHRVYCKGLAD